MSGVREYAKKFKSTLMLAIAFSAVLGVLIVVHLIGVQVMADKEMREDMKTDVEIGASMISDRIYSLFVIADHAAAELGEIAEFPSPEMEVVLSNFRAHSEFEETYFLTVSGHMYRYTGQEIPVTSDQVADISKERFDQSSRLVTGKFNFGNSNILLSKPVINNGQKLGYFVGGFSFEQIVRHDIRKFMEVEGTFMVLDARGNVLEVEVTEETSEFENISNLINYCEGLQDSEAAVNELNALIGHTNTEYSTLSMGDKSYGFTCSGVDRSGGWSVACIVPKKNFLAALVHQRRGEAALLLFDIALLIVTMIAVSILSARKDHQLEAVAYSDTITSAKTKEFFRIAGEEFLRETEIPYAVVAADIVGFRYVNELFGHERGDEILTHFATLLGENLGSKEIVARNTGDYFELLVVDVDSFVKRIEDLSEDLNAYARSIDVTYPLVLRVGVVRSTKSNRDIRNLLDKANAARKTVQADSGILVAEYSAKIQEDLKSREEIESSMNSAMAHGEFKLFLQPKMDVRTGKLSGAEGLVRWIKRDGTMVYPDRFIPIFETNGFVEKLDFYMLERVCELQESLKKRGYERVPISVNQSRVLLMNPAYVSRVMEVMEKYEVERHLVELELTETSFFDDKNKMIEIMRELRSKNCVIDIDDFGSGYSSLNMIKDIPFDVLKIDREFFNTSSTDTGKIILQKIVELATALGVESICEGVENAEQEEILREIGCHYAQGYYYSKPIPAEEFVEKFMQKSPVEENE